MANLTENEHPLRTEELLCTNIFGQHHDIFITAFSIFFSATASLGNVLILVALHKESSLHPPSKLMLCCLAITDLAVGLTSQPMFAAQLLSEMKKLRHLCNYFEMLTRITGLVFSGVSLMTAAAMSVDRLLALSLGLRYRHVVTMKRVCAILSCFWFVCVAVSLIDGFWTRSSFIISKVVPTVIVLCIVTSVYCYRKIFFRLRGHQVHMQDQVHQGQPNGGEIARYRKTVSTALWLQITLVACYLPQALVRASASLFPMSDVSFVLGLRYAISLMYLNSSLNPFLYIWRIREVRKAVKDIIRQYCCFTS